MTHPTTPLTIYPAEGNPVILQAPQGEAAYWGRLIASRACVWALAVAETPHLPYLGYVRCPEDRLAAEWLIDQHTTQPIQETK